MEEELSSTSNRRHSGSVHCRGHGGGSFIGGGGGGHLVSFMVDENLPVALVPPSSLAAEKLHL
jgi:hypothetical protein